MNKNKKTNIYVINDEKCRVAGHDLEVLSDVDWFLYKSYRHERTLKNIDASNARSLMRDGMSYIAKLGGEIGIVYFSDYSNITTEGIVSSSPQEWSDIYCVPTHHAVSWLLEKLYSSAPSKFNSAVFFIIKNNSGYGFTTMNAFMPLCATRLFGEGEITALDANELADYISNPSLFFSESGRKPQSMQDFTFPSISNEEAFELAMYGAIIASDIKNSLHQTPLMYLAYKEDSDGVMQRIDCGDDINAKDMFGYTPLHIACHLRNEKIAKILLENGADPRSSNVDGLSPLEIATNNSMIIRNDMLPIFESLRLKRGATDSLNKEISQINVIGL